MNITAIQKKLITIAICMLYVVSAFGMANDSTAIARKDTLAVKVKKPTTMNDTWYHGDEPDVRYIIDSSIFNFEQYNPIQKTGTGIEYTNAGNSGSAAFPLVYSADKSTGFNTGYNQFDLYRYAKDSVKYYQVVRPYTEILMMIGLKKEFMFQGKFANQHKNMVFYGVEFTRISSLGQYSRAQTNNNGFNLYGIYKSKNKHWNLQADLIFNNTKNQENGGVTGDVFDSALFRNNLATTRLTQAENLYRQTDFYAKASYIAGKKYDVRVNDSTTTKELMPVFKMSYQFNVERSKYKFLDVDPLPEYYGSFYEFDSVFNNINYLKFGNAFMLEYNWRKLTSDSSYEDKNFKVYAELGYDHYLFTQNSLTSSFGNLYVGGTVRNNRASKSNILYKGTVKYYPYGWNQNDLLLDGMAGYDFGKWGMIMANFTYNMKELPYIYERYNSHPVEFSMNQPKQKTVAVGGKYHNIKWGIAADANYYFIGNLPVYPISGQPFFAGGAQQNFAVVHAGQNNAIAGVHFENDIWVTISNGKGSITDLYSFIYTKHSIYYERRVFKKALWFSTGFDVRFRYPHNPPAYDPLTGAFTPSAVSTRLVPQLDFFLNLKIRTVRVFAKVDNLVSAMIQKGYYSLNNYPAADLSFKFGLNWRFFE